MNSNLLVFMVGILLTLVGVLAYFKEKKSKSNSNSKYMKYVYIVAGILILMTLL